MNWEMVSYFHCCSGQGEGGGRAGGGGGGGGGGGRKRQRVVTLTCNWRSGFEMFTGAIAERVAIRKEFFECGNVRV